MALLEMLVTLAFSLVFNGCTAAPLLRTPGPENFRVFTNNETDAFLEQLEQQFPDNVRLSYLGQSAGICSFPISTVTIGRDLTGWRSQPWTCQEDPTKDSPTADVLIIANMHGDEIVNRVVTLNIINDLVKQVNEIPFLKQFRITFIPSLNPSSFEEGYRTIREKLFQAGDNYFSPFRNNADGIDLNRNFPDYFHSSWVGAQKTAAETELVHQLLSSWPFALVLNFHDGAALVNYPYDCYPVTNNKDYARSADEELFKYLATAYASAHAHFPTIESIERGINSETADFYCLNGSYEAHVHILEAQEALKFLVILVNNLALSVTTGAVWYDIHGSLQDYVYSRFGVPSLLVEMSCCKFPYHLISNGDSTKTSTDKSIEISQMNRFYRTHFELNSRGLSAMLTKAASSFIDGQVLVNCELSVCGCPAVGARVMICGRSHDVSVAPNGRFQRVIEPGLHRLMAIHESGISEIVTVNMSKGPVKLVLRITRNTIAKDAKCSHSYPWKTPDEMETSPLSESDNEADLAQQLLSDSPLSTTTEKSSLGISGAYEPTIATVVHPVFCLPACLLSFLGAI